MPLSETITAHGHEHVTAGHESTFEVTTEDFLTPAGDCILGIGADRAPADFSSAFVAACQDEQATIEARLQVTDSEWVVTGRGDPALTFASATSAVGRTSTYVDDRTVLVAADGAAEDLDRSMVRQLADGARAELTLTVR